MDWKTIDADLACIDVRDSTYRITTARKIEPLAASIGVTGLLNAPLIAPSGRERYIVVAGFRRVEACRLLKMQRIAARCMHADTPPGRLAEIAVADNTGQRPLNLVESSRALRLLRHHIQDERRFGEVCRKLGLPMNPSMAAKVAGICQMADPIQEAVLKGVVTLTCALELDSLGRDTGATLATLFVDLHCSQSTQREILANLREISARDDIDVYGLLQDPRLQELITASDEDRNLRLQKVRNHFRTKRYPRLSLAEKQFLETTRTLSLGDNIRLQAPAGFESGEYLFKLRVSTMADMRACIGSLERTLENPSLKKILKQ
ncbi:MAG: ParB N-terminal domain-containing protein [Deltaproteobacteria bacterium]|nr:ParB N-terminal domain-containing protein [Deltaproteobacteria bacterium]